MSTRLFSLPPSQSNGRGFHEATTETLTTKHLRVKQADVEITITDSLADANGDALVDPDTIQFARSVSQPSPGQGNGRVWVRDGASPYTLMFTDENGNDIELPPTLESLLITSPDGENQALVNLNRLDTTPAGGILVGNSATGPGVAVGVSARAPTANSLVIGTESATAQGYSVILGAQNTIHERMDTGGVVVGSGNVTQGRTICIGSDNSDAGYSDGAVGSNFVLGHACQIVGGDSTFSALAIGDGVIVSMPSTVCIGTDASAMNNVNGDGVAGVAIGKGAAVAYAYCIAVGENATANPQIPTGTGCIALGRDSAATGGNANIACGFQTAASGLWSPLAIGAYSSASSSQAVAIGGGTLPSDGAVASAINAVAIGAASASNQIRACVIGADLSARVSDEISFRGWRTIRGTATTTTGIATSVLSFPLVLGNVVIANAYISGYSNDNKTYVAVFEGYHFRVKSSGLNKAPGIGTFLEDNSETLTFASSLSTASGNNVQVLVSGAAGKSVQWKVVLELYCSPLN